MAMIEAVTASGVSFSIPEQNIASWEYIDALSVLQDKSALVKQDEAHAGDLVVQMAHVVRIALGDGVQEVMAEYARLKGRPASLEDLGEVINAIGATNRGKK